MLTLYIDLSYAHRMELAWHKSLKKADDSCLSKAICHRPSARVEQVTKEISELVKRRQLNKYSCGRIPLMILESYMKHARTSTCEVCLHPSNPCYPLLAWIRNTKHKDDPLFIDFIATTSAHTHSNMGLPAASHIVIGRALCKSCVTMIMTLLLSGPPIQGCLWSQRMTGNNHEFDQCIAGSMRDSFSMS